MALTFYVPTARAQNPLSACDRWYGPLPEQLKDFRGAQVTDKWRRGWLDIVLPSRHIDATEATLNDYVRALRALPAEAGNATILEQVKIVVLRLNELDATYEFIATNEREELTCFIDKAARLSGFQAPPNIDITDSEGWSRTW